MVEFKLNDPVKVSQKNDAPLKGIIAYLGSVDFAEGDDWVGVRLTGDSVGKGKNNGSVQGRVYFSTTQENAGVFVRRANVSPWVLSKLEELRLKREIQGIGPSSRSPSGIKSSSKEDDDSSVSSMRSSVTGTSSKSRLEEIRARRIALQQKNQLGMSPAPKNVIESKAISRSISSPSPLKSKSILSTPGSMGRVASASVNTNKAASSRIRNEEDTEKTTATPSKSHDQSEVILKLRQSEETIASLTQRLQQQQALHQETSKEVERLQSQLLKLSNDLDTKSSENQNLKASLKKSEEASLQAQTIANEFQNAAKKARTEVDDATTKSTTMESDQKSSQYLEEIATLKAQLVESRDEKEHYARENSILEERCNRALSQNESLQKKLETEQEHYETLLRNTRQELSGAQSKISLLEKEIAQTGDKVALREDNNASQYKERAKLQAELLSLQRQCKELEKEKQDLDKSLEDLALDKEALQEKLEVLEDKYEELKIDAESAQIEADELKLELDEARERAERLEAANVLKSAARDSQPDGLGQENTEAEQVAQALSVQNARLREALLRLREQSNAEKIDLTKQIRSMEREYEAAKSLKEELEQLQKNEAVMKEEIKDLKEMVDQGAAFEQMVEQMSERVIAVEENNVMLQGMIRELEEASELSAEMEETQAEEIKALILDLQGRDTIVANLEEAIKMQRRRELDFERTIGNYKSLLDTVQRERDSLLVEIGSRDGIQSDAILSSQKALAQAAQSVADAELARKKDAESTFHLVDAKVKSHLAERLEDFLPQNVALSEITAVKGELLLTKIAMKASLSLTSVSDLFDKSINQARKLLTDSELVNGSDAKLSISSNLGQQIAALIHQTRFAQVAIDLSSQCMTLLAVGQWPDIISAQASVNLGCFLAHSISALDSGISEQLSLLKREGTLSPHRSNLNILSQAMANLRLGLHDLVDEDGHPVVPLNWSLPCIDAFKALSASKFFCYGATSILCSIVMDEATGLQNVSDTLIGLVLKAEKLCREMSSAYSILSTLDVSDDSSVTELCSITPSIEKYFRTVFETVESASKANEISTEILCSILSDVDTAAGYLVKLYSFIRSKELVDDNSHEVVHSLAPEVSDPWVGIVNAAKKVQSGISNVHDLNFITRGRNLEGQLSAAVENDAKLTIANDKINILEKNLATRSKEIAIQNSRLEELETLLAEIDKNGTTSNMSPKSSKSPDQTRKLKDEIKNLTETIDVLQSQVDEYEKEIRSLKDQKSKSSRRSAPGSASKKGVGPENDYNLSSLGISSPHKKSSMQDSPTTKNALLLESTLFRPALKDALSDASWWKAKVISEKLDTMPPLNASFHSHVSNQQNHLILACADYRRAKTSMNILSLKSSKAKTDIRRDTMLEHNLRISAALKRCENISSSIHFSILSKTSSSVQAS